MSHKSCSSFTPTSSVSRIDSGMPSADGFCRHTPMHPALLPVFVLVSSIVYFASPSSAGAQQGGVAGFHGASFAGIGGSESGAGMRNLAPSSMNSRIGSGFSGGSPHDQLMRGLQYVEGRFVAELNLAGNRRAYAAPTVPGPTVSAQRVLASTAKPTVLAQATHSVHAVSRRIGPAGGAATGTQHPHQQLWWRTPQPSTQPSTQQATVVPTEIAPRSHAWWTPSARRPAAAAKVVHVSAAVHSEMRSRR